MELYVESYPLSINEKNEYFNFVEKMKSKETWKENIDFDNEYYKYIHVINFNKDLKLTELINIKEFLRGNDDILASWIKDEKQNELILFNKDQRF